MALCEEGAAVLVTVKDSIFFSPIQILQRDLAVQTIISFLQSYLIQERKSIHILDAFSGCGIRAIRYALEVEGVGKVTANDINPNSQTVIRENWEASRTVGSNETCEFEITSQDANVLLGSSPNTFDIIDLDPCGSPSPFIRSAVSSIRNGGLLCVACTDYKDLAGLNGDGGAQRSFSRYGGWVGVSNPDHASAFMTETAMRVIINMIGCVAGSVGRRIECCLCASFSFFIRICVRVFDITDLSDTSLRPLLARRYSQQHSKLNKWLKSGQFEVLRLGSQTANVGVCLGPLYGGAQLCNVKLLEAMISRIALLGNQKIQSLVGEDPSTWQVVSFNDDECPGDVVFADCSLRDLFQRSVQHTYNNSLLTLLRLLLAESRIGLMFSYCMREMAQTRNVIVHRGPIIARLKLAGFTAAPSHADASSLKTNAPFPQVQQAIDQYIEACQAGSAVQGGGRVIEQCRRKCEAREGLSRKKSRVRSREQMLTGEFSDVARRSVVETTLLQGSPIPGVCNCCYEKARNYSRKHGGRVVLVGGVGSDVFEHAGSLAEACTHAKQGDAVLLQKGDHKVPSDGLCLRTPQIWLVGCAHLTIGASVRISRSSEHNDKSSKPTAMISVSAKDVVMSGLEITCGVKETENVIVEGDGSSLLLTHSTLLFRPIVKPPISPTPFKPGKKNNRRVNENKPIGILVASCAMLKCQDLLILGNGGDCGCGVLVSGRGGALLDRCDTQAMGGCALLVQSGGVAMMMHSTISQALTGAAVSGMGSSLTLSRCKFSQCGRLYVEASRQSRLHVRRCVLGLQGAGSGGGGVLVKHASTFAAINNCLVNSTRLASLDVRDDAHLSLCHSVLEHSRTSGVYTSARSTVALGEGCSFFHCGLAAVEAVTGAQVVCQDQYIADVLMENISSEGGGTEIIDTHPQCPTSVEGCSTPLLVSHGASFGVFAS